MISPSNTCISGREGGGAPRGLIMLGRNSIGKNVEKKFSTQCKKLYQKILLRY